jgi:Tol biopolymer transport system component
MDDTAAQNQTARGERLDSWKEIASYLKRDIRTVQRWEKQEALPVHRHLHDERGTAYAYSGEIDQWLQNRSRRDNEPAPVGDAELSEPLATSTRPSVAKWSRLPVAVAILAAVVAGAIGIWALSRSRPDPTPLSSLSVVFGPSERIREWGPDTALSPDGSTLVYTAESGQLNVRRIDELTARALPGTARSWGPFFSPDGRWIGFNRGEQLMKVPIEGGAAVPLGVTTAFIGSADWGADDNIIYAATTPEGTHGLYRVSANGGAPQLIAALDGNADDAYWLTPQSLANGRIILSTLARTVTSGPRFQVVAVSVSSGERRMLVDDARHALYIGDGVLVYWRNDALFATRLDLDRVEVTGPHVPAWDGVWERIRMRSWTSAAGTLVYWPNASVSHRLVWVDRAGKQEPLPLPPAMYHAPRVSPDGRTVAYSAGTDFSSDVWTYDVASGGTVRLTSDGRAAVPLWRPDGSGLIVSWLRPTGRDLAQLDLSGTAGLRPIALPATFLAGASKLPTSWADGGRTLLVRQYGAERQPQIWALTLDGSREPRPVVSSAIYANVSTNGRWIAYTAQDSTTARNEVYVAPFPAGRPEWKVSTSGGVLPVWSRSGRELFYRQGNRIMTVPVTLGETFTSGSPRPLFEVPFYEGDPGSPNYDVAADDQRFVIVLPASTGGPDRLNVVQGWKKQILRRLGDSR